MKCGDEDQNEGTRQEEVREDKRIVVPEWISSRLYRCMCCACFDFVVLNGERCSVVRFLWWYQYQ